MDVFRSREGESCVVTGGAGGIGAASASLWLSQGGSVVIADVDDEAGAAFVSRCPRGRAVFVHCDTRRREDLQRAIQAARKLGRFCVPQVLLRERELGIASPPLLARRARLPGLRSLLGGIYQAGHRVDPACGSAAGAVPPQRLGLGVGAL